MLLQIQPDLITLDPEMVGNLAPPSKMTTTTFDGKPAVEVPYARLPRIERLRVSGKIDETEENPEDTGDGDEETKKHIKEEREKRKMRGKGKSLKRYLRKQRKNVIDPAAVCLPFLCLQFTITNDFRLPSAPNWRSRKRRKSELLPRPPTVVKSKNLLHWIVSSVPSRIISRHSSLMLPNCVSQPTRACSVFVAFSVTTLLLVFYAAPRLHKLGDITSPPFVRYSLRRCVAAH